MGATVIKASNGGESFDSISEGDTAVTVARRTIITHAMVDGDNNPHASLEVITTGTGISDAGDGGIQSFASQTYSTVGGPQQSIALYGGNTCSKSAGTDPLTNYGLLVSAEGGDNNYAIYSTAGDVHIEDSGNFNGDLSVGGSLSCSTVFSVNPSTNAVVLGNNVQNFKIIPQSGGALLGIGGAYASGGQVTLKNMNAGSTVSGMDIGLDTTVNANVWGGVFLWRGANAAFGGSTESFFAFSGGADMPGANANDLGIGNWTSGKRILFYSDGAAFGVTALLNATEFAGRTIRTGGSDVGGSGNGASWRSGAGSPEGSVTANKGDLYSDTTNGDLYVKTTANATNTDWKKATLA